MPLMLQRRSTLGAPFLNGKIIYRTTLSTDRAVTILQRRSTVGRHFE